MHLSQARRVSPDNGICFLIFSPPDAKLIPTVKNQEGKVVYRYWTPDGYKEQAGNYLVENGFHEVEIFRVTEEYGPIVHIFSTYESRNSINDAEPFARGINSIQLLNDGERWWILNIFWSSETKENPLPTKYLPQLITLPVILAAYICKKTVLNGKEVGDITLGDYI